MKPQVWAPVLGMLALLAFLGWMAVAVWGARSDGTSWTELKTMVAEGEIAEVLLDGDIVRARKKNAPADKADSYVVVVRVPGDQTFYPLLEQHAVPYRATRRSVCSDGMAPMLILPLLMLGLFWAFMLRGSESARGTQAFGRSTASLAPEEGTGASFDDVAGVEEALDELKEIVAFLQTPERFTALGGRPPKGVLLVGPPGTGKTLLARAIAGEAGVPFFSISGSSFVEMFVGVGAARVRDLFKQATEHAPCIIFVDELDAVGKARGMGGPASNDEREQTLNQLLVEMDGFDNRSGIIVMAATNRPEILDKALLRAGRFDRQVLVDRPDLRGREQILEVHARKLKLGESVDLHRLAQSTPGFAGADLANALNEAALLAARRDATAIEMNDITDAIERLMAGLEKKTRRISPQEKRTVAIHEVGHAICAAASPGADPVSKISIIPRGLAALGYTMQLPLEDRYLMSKAELLNRVTILFGGRAAEELVLGDVTTGAQDDISKATDLARRMVTEFGMSKRIGAVNYALEDSGFGFGPSGQVASGSPETAEAIESEIRRILDSCHQRAIEMLVANRVVLEEMSATLLEHEVLSGELMERFLEQVDASDSLEDRPTGEWVRIDPTHEVS